MRGFLLVALFRAYFKALNSERTMEQPVDAEGVLSREKTAKTYSIRPCLDTMRLKKIYRDVWGGRLL